MKRFFDSYEFARLLEYRLRRAGMKQYHDKFIQVVKDALRDYQLDQHEKLPRHIDGRVVNGENLKR